MLITAVDDYTYIDIHTCVYIYDKIYQSYDHQHLAYYMAYHNFPVFGFLQLGPSFSNRSHWLVI